MQLKLRTKKRELRFFLLEGSEVSSVEDLSSLVSISAASAVSLEWSAETTSIIVDVLL